MIILLPSITTTTTMLMTIMTMLMIVMMMMVVIVIQRPTANDRDWMEAVFFSFVNIALQEDGVWCNG